MKIPDADMKLYLHNPLKFWEKEALHFPHLSKLSVSLLIVQASSGASERMFSKSGWMSSCRLNRIEKDLLEAKTFLSCNKELFREILFN